MYNVDVLEFTSDKIFVALPPRDDVSGCQGRDRGPLPNSFHDLRFANSAVNTGKVGGNIVKFYQRGEGREGWKLAKFAGARGGKGTFRVLARNRLRDRAIGPTLSALHPIKEKCRVEEISRDRSSDSKATFVLGEISSSGPVLTISRSMIQRFVQNRSFVPSWNLNVRAGEFRSSHTECNKSLREANW